MQSLLRSCFICLVLIALANCKVEQEHGIAEGSTMEEHEDNQEHGVEMESEQEELEDAGESEDSDHDELEDPEEDAVSGHSDGWQPLTSTHLEIVIGEIDQDGDGAMSMEEAKSFVIDMDKASNLRHAFESVRHLPGNEEGGYSSEELLHWHQEHAADPSDSNADGHAYAAHSLRFDFADRNSDGVLVGDEIIYYVDPMHNHEQNVETEREFSQLDEDASGTLTMQEYYTEKDVHEGTPQEEAVHEFEVLDQDGNGVLSIDEFKAYNNGTFDQHQDVRLLFGVADLDKDAKITHDELKDEAVLDALLSQADGHYHRLHDWAKHLGVVVQAKEHDEHGGPDDPDGDASRHPDEDESEDPDDDEAGGPDEDMPEAPTDDESVQPLMFVDLQSILMAVDQDNDGNMSMEEAKVFVIKMDRVAEELPTDEATNEEGFYTSEGLLKWDQVGYDEPRDEIHRIKFAAADLDQDGALDDVEIVHYFHPVDDQVQTLEAAHQLKELDSDGSGDLTIQEYSLDPASSDDIAPEFRILDQDGNGLLNVQEYRAMSNGSFHQDQDLRYLFDIADLDKDAKITHSELGEAKEELLDTEGEHYDRLRAMAKHLDL